MSGVYTAGQRLYRAHVSGSVVSGYASISYTTFTVVVTTLRGAWIYRKMRWIGDSTQYAQPSKEAARKALLVRKRAHVNYAERQLSQAEHELEAIMAGLDGSLDNKPLDLGCGGIFDGRR